MLKEILKILTFILNSCSVIIIVWGVILAFIAFVKLELKTNDRLDTVKKITTIKNYLGTYILLGLEILICADIIESILNPSIQDILVLASIVIIRTIISYFLNKELKSSEK
ncbi:DUF1622 domain-containing protein [Clostridium sp.]|uniref:DUF1622 domain-containing protein n=1 Tax=Clostridium sp. TaxID=1506 RepID=UPI0026DC2A02|nr:DUF1622 domain-containing protein [Clostridium sp.]MDO5039549.1 DUF1622 domain-containing protein [Clostridium sp.]